MQDSEDYRSLLKQYELILQQLEGAKNEIRTLREQSEKYRSEILVIKSSSESGVSSIRYELESAKAENVRLTQIIEALRNELENMKKENSGVHCSGIFYVIFLITVISVTKSCITIFGQTILFCVASHNPPAIRRI